MIHKLKDILFKIDRYACIAGNVCIVLNMALVVFNIILRNIGGRSLAGITDYAGFISCLIVVLCLGYTESQNGNPKVDFIMNYLPVVMQKIAFTIVSLLDLAVGVLLSYSFFQYAVTSTAAGTTSMNANLPYPPFLIVCGIGMTFFSLTVLVKALCRLVFWGGEEA